MTVGHEARRGSKDVNITQLTPTRPEGPPPPYRLLEREPSMQAAPMMEVLQQLGNWAPQGQMPRPVLERAGAIRALQLATLARGQGQLAASAGRIPEMLQALGMAMLLGGSNSLAPNPEQHGA